MSKRPVSFQRYRDRQGHVRLAQARDAAQALALGLSLDPEALPFGTVSLASDDRLSPLGETLSAFPQLALASQWLSEQAHSEGPSLWAAAAVAWAQLSQPELSEKAALEALRLTPRELWLDMASSLASLGAWPFTLALAFQQRWQQALGTAQAYLHAKARFQQSLQAGQAPELKALRTLEALALEAFGPESTTFHEVVLSCLAYPATDYAASSFWEWALKRLSDPLRQGLSEPQISWVMARFPLQGEARASAKAWVNLLVKTQTLKRWADKAPPEAAYAWWRKALTSIGFEAPLKDALLHLQGPLRHAPWPLDLSWQGPQGLRLELTWVVLALQAGLQVLIPEQAWDFQWQQLPPSCEEVLAHTRLGPALLKAWERHQLEAWPWTQPPSPEAKALSRHWLSQLLERAEAGELLAQELLIQGLSTTPSHLRATFPEFHPAFEAFLPRAKPHPRLEETSEQWLPLPWLPLWQGGGALWGLTEEQAQDSGPLEVQLRALVSALSHREPVELPACALPWPYAWVYPRALAWMACTPQRSSVERRTLLQALSQIWRILNPARLSLLGFQSVQLYQVRLAYPLDGALLQRQQRGGLAYSLGAERRVELWQPNPIEGSNAFSYWVLRFHTELNPAPPEDLDLVSAWPIAWGEHTWLERLWHYEGPPFEPRWHPQAQSQVMAQTGLSAPEAARLLLGLWDKHRLPTSEWLHAAKLSGPELRQAFESLPTLSGAKLWAFLHASTPEDPWRLFESQAQPQATERLIQAYLRRFGVKKGFSPDHITTLTSELGSHYPWTQLGRSLLDPERLEALSVSPQQACLDLFKASEVALSYRVSAHLLELCLWLIWQPHAPADLKEAVLPLLKALRSQLRAPERLLPLAYMPAKALSLPEAPLPALPGLPHQHYPHPLGLCLVHEGQAFIAYAPARASLAEAQALRQHPEARPWVEPEGMVRWEVAAWLLGAEGTDLLEALDPLTSTTFSASPLVSAPEVVSDLAKAFALSPEQACLWLQSLAFAHPTKAWVMAVNHWSPKHYQAHADALVQAGKLYKGTYAKLKRPYLVPGPLTQTHGESEAPFEAIKGQWLPSAWQMGFRRTLPMLSPQRLFARVFEYLAKHEGPFFEGKPEG